MTDNEIIQKIWDISEDDPINLDNLHIKLSEEMGELAAAHLMYYDFKGTKKSKEQILENYLEESCDCIIILIAIMKKKGFNIDEFYEMLSKKLSKYSKRCNK